MYEVINTNADGWVTHTTSYRDILLSITPDIYYSKLSAVEDNYNRSEKYSSCFTNLYDIIQDSFYRSEMETCSEVQ